MGKKELIRMRILSLIRNCPFVVDFVYLRNDLLMNQTLFPKTVVGLEPILISDIDSAILSLIEGNEITWLENGFIEIGTI